EGAQEAVLEEEMPQAARTDTAAAAPAMAMNLRREIIFIRNSLLFYSCMQPFSGQIRTCGHSGTFSILQYSRKMCWAQAVLHYKIFTIFPSNCQKVIHSLHGRRAFSARIEARPRRKQKRPCRQRQRRCRSLDIGGAEAERQ